MANLLQASNKCTITWKQGTTTSVTNENIGCLHLTVHDKQNQSILAKATLSANQLVAYCINNNKL